MSVEAAPMRRITISLPDDLVDFADREAARRSISRSRLIAQALSEVKAKEEERLAAEGYRFYAQEASRFAEASAAAVAEAVDHDGWCAQPELQCKKRMAIPARRLYNAC